MATLTSLSVTFTSEPEGLPLAEDIQPASIIAIVEALEDPADTAGKWIDNKQHRGISGTVTGQILGAIVPSAQSDARAVVQVWLDDTGAVRRIRIEGRVARNEPEDAFRELDLGDLD